MITVTKATLDHVAITPDGFQPAFRDVEYEIDNGCTCAQLADCGPGVGGPHSDMGPNYDPDETMPWEREQQGGQTREEKQTPQTRADDDFDLGVATPYSPDDEEECDACQ